MARWFAATMFVAAFLLFLVQPFIGKLLLPHVGGAPAVWNTCMVFFQAALLAGYAFVHLATRWLSFWQQVALQCALLATAAFVLPIRLPPDGLTTAVGTEYPVFVLLRVLVLHVGLPFFVVATTAPLLQRWFTLSGQRSANDPYFLYAASNVGSLLALTLFPLVVEPFFGLVQQARLWTVGFGMYAVLVVGCACLLRRPHRSDPVVAQDATHPTEPGISFGRRWRWVFYAFVPSSLLLSVTAHLSTDIAPIPLLWIVPLGLYLLTFILAFSRRQWMPLGLVNRLLPISVLMVALIFLTGATTLRGLPVGVLLALHLGAFFLAALLAHGELARARPTAQHLTEFYLFLSVGGVLGGVFNGLLAPVLFARTGLTEYPLALVLTCFLRPPPLTPARMAAPAQKRVNQWDLVLPSALAGLTAGLIVLAQQIAVPEGPWRTALMFGLPCVLAYTFVDRPWRFGLGIAALLLAESCAGQSSTRRLERNFFGVLRVAEVQTASGRALVLYHGNTVHGEQSLESRDDSGRHEPRTYYHRKGPIGAVCQRWLSARPHGQRVGAVGLGTGSLAYYARSRDDWTFYEIDPAVARIAQRDFAFLAECRGRLRPIVLGDARLRLREEPDHSFDLLVLDAFSSDAIPAHLLTREALAEYLRKLRPDGMLAFHVSNRYLFLPPIVARLAENQGTPLVVRGWDDVENNDIGKAASQWLVVAASDEVLMPLFFLRPGSSGTDPFWQRVTPKPNTPLWTDDRTNIVPALTWGERDEVP